MLGAVQGRVLEFLQQVSCERPGEVPGYAQQEVVVCCAMVGAGHGARRHGAPGSRACDWRLGFASHLVSRDLKWLKPDLNGF